MTTIKNLLFVLTLLAVYGIVGNMDYTEEIESERRQQDARLLWRDCITGVALREVETAPQPGAEERCRVAFLRQE
jgi:hypothetical protein